MAMTEGRVSKLEDRLTKLFNQTRKEKKIGNNEKKLMDLSDNIKRSEKLQVSEKF